MKQYRSPSKTCVLFTSGLFVTINEGKTGKSGEGKLPPQCTVCKKKFSSATSNSSLYYHLRNIHEKEFNIFQKMYPDYKKAEVPVDECEDDSGTSNTVTELQHTEPNNQLTKSTKRVSPSSNLFSPPEKRAKQMTINTMFQPSTSVQQKFIHSVSRCFADASIPYRQVESPLFWDMLENYHR